MKVLALIFVAVFAFGMVACGDDDDGGGGADNEAACNSLFETLSELECVDDSYDWGVDCSAYAGDAYPCDISDYWNCLEDGSTCDDSFDPPILDISAWADCTAPACE